MQETRKIFYVLLILVSLVPLAAVLQVVDEQDTPQATALARPPNRRVTATESLNWAGYAVLGDAGSVSDVKASWVVPSVAGCGPKENSFSSFWTGIDGYNSNTVEQIGSDSDCIKGKVTYFVWYEFYPQPFHVIKSLTINPGDTIFAEVSYSSGSFTVTLQDLTTEQSFSTTFKDSFKAERSSAEWITEGPVGGSLTHYEPEANFGERYTGVTHTNFATISGFGISGSAPIGEFNKVNPNSVARIDMVNRGGSVRASTWSLAHGTSFTVTWISFG